MTIDEFIIELQSISEDKRKLPLVITAPNGLLFEPSIKMMFKNNIPSWMGGTLEKMLISW